MNLQSTVAVLGLTVLSVIPAYAGDVQPVVTEKSPEMLHENYVPGMGEIMGLTQMRHSKLWFAGNARNWELASYELDEIKEGMDDAVKFHPVFKKDAPIADILAKFTTQPLNEIESAIRAKDGVKFKKSFDKLTKACNECHQAAGQGFIVIKRPSVLPYSNQVFVVKDK